MTTGEKIYTLREKAGLSQDELAEKLEVTRQTVSNWENDKNKIDLEKAKRLCEVFGITPNELCSDGEEGSGAITARNKKSKKSVIIFAVAVLIISSAVLVTAIIFASFADVRSETASSVIAFNAAFGWVAVAVLSLIVMLVNVIVIFRMRGK